MTMVQIKIRELHFTAQMEETDAPQTCKAFRGLLPWQTKLLHVRWSGEACWIPMGDSDLGVGYENHTSYPSRGEVLFYPGGISETEILIPYGATHFVSKVGPLAGNHFLTIVEGREQLQEVGRRALWEGAQDILIELV